MNSLLAGGEATRLHAAALRRERMGRRGRLLMHRAERLPPALEALSCRVELGCHTSRAQGEVCRGPEEVFEVHTGSQGLRRTTVLRDLGGSPKDEVSSRVRRHVACA